MDQGVAKWIFIILIWKDFFDIKGKILQLFFGNMKLASWVTVVER